MELTVSCIKCDTDININSIEIDKCVERLASSPTAISMVHILIRHFLLNLRREKKKTHKMRAHKHIEIVEIKEKQAIIIIIMWKTRQRQKTIVETWINDFISLFFSVGKTEKDFLFYFSSLSHRLVLLIRRYFWGCLVGCSLCVRCLALFAVENVISRSSTSKSKSRTTHTHTRWRKQTRERWEIIQLGGIDCALYSSHCILVLLPLSFLSIFIFATDGNGKCGEWVSYNLPSQQ